MEDYEVDYSKKLMDMGNFHATHTQKTLTQIIDLTGKNAIVTGGTTGLGYALANRLSEAGASVVIVGRSEAKGRIAEEQFRARGREVSYCQADLTSPEECDKVVSFCEEKYGPVDILVNNAGMSESTPFHEYTEELFDKVMDLNVKGIFNATKAASDYMISQGQGVILSTSSMVSISGQASGFAYPTSKFAVNGMTISLARELAPKGIRVNAVAPGITETDMMKAVPKEVIEPLISQIPMRRLGQPEDIANAFAFLASEEASYITGVVLSVDGMARA